MRIAVIGAGIVGVTTAYELAADGHEVCVFERLGSVAAGESFAPAGLLAPGTLWPWQTGASDRRWFMPWKATAPTVRIARGADRSARRWAGRAAKAQASLPREALHRLSLFSQQRLREISHTHRLATERTEGVLVLLRSRESRQLVEPGIVALAELGIAHQRLDADGCRAIEPGLNPEAPLYGGIHLPDAESGNCRAFAGLLRSEMGGVQFRYHTAVQHIVPGPRPEIVRMYAPPDEPPVAAPGAASNAATRVDRDDPPTLPMAPEPVTERFDAIVLCTGVQTNALLGPLGLTLPLQAVWGCSVTAPIRHNEQHPDQGPRAAVIDIARGISIGRIGNRLRVAGGQDIGGQTGEPPPGALDDLYACLHDWYPGISRLDQGLPWKGARPSLPDGAPVIGASGQPGLWLNLGHGDHGWALACGSARVLADQIAGRTPAVDAERFGLSRWLPR